MQACGLMPASRLMTNDCVVKCCVHKRSNSVTFVLQQNELFFPGRMAYIMDLEEEADSDIPTTTIRSIYLSTYIVDLEEEEV